MQKKQIVCPTVTHNFVNYYNNTEMLVIALP